MVVNPLQEIVERRPFGLPAIAQVVRRRQRLDLRARPVSASLPRVSPAAVCTECVDLYPAQPALADDASARPDRRIDAARSVQDAAHRPAVIVEEELDLGALHVSRDTRIREAARAAPSGSQRPESPP